VAKIYFIVFVSIAFIAKAQEDTTYLDVVKVLGVPINRYTPGSKIQIIKEVNGTTLTDLLSNESPLYFKTYGNGQLATISFRGTSASHTAVMWNGINVNSPTLGQTDFTLWPSFLLEEIGLQYGAGSALYGTDAIGGSVLINPSQPKFDKKQKIELRQEAGSFGHWLSGVKTTFSTKKMEFRTKVFYRSLQNDFKYTSPKVGYEKTQINAAIENYGLDQQIHWRISDSKQLSFLGQYVYNFREIQPTVTRNDSDEVLKDRNTRVAVNYQQDIGHGNLFATVGYIVNDELYNRSSRTKSNQIAALMQYDFIAGSKTNVKAGGNFTRYIAQSGGFDGSLNDNRYDAFLSLRHRINSIWISSLNLRQSFYAQHETPFAPSWGNEFLLLKNRKIDFKLKTQLARAYRVPTLNDRYWNPGGNPDLTPESGYNAELGIELTYKEEAHEFAIDAAHHRSWINQWIIWTPNEMGIWSPSNLSKVNVSGIESGIKHTWSYRTLKINSGINYAFTQSLNKKGLNDADVSIIDKQLPYVPIHSGHAFIKAQKQKWDASIHANYTGLRYTTLDNEVYQGLKAYTVLNTSLGRNIDLRGFSFSLKISANNLFNKYYENIENRAIPGRNYLFTLNVKL
jgi:vitamin B12 transporter